MNWREILSERWPVVPLRRVLRSIEQGWSPVADDRRAEDTEWAVIKLSAVSPAGFAPEEHKALAEGTVPEKRFEIRVGDVLLTRANTPELVGEACLVRATRPHLMLCDLVYRLNVNVAAVEPRFLVYWLGSRPGRSQVEADARGSSQSMVKVSQGHIRSWLTPVPSLTEQRIIADFLDRKTEAIDRLLDGAAATLGVGDNVVGAVPRMIALLREYRLSIITAAVTGQLDVAGQEAA